MTLLPFPKISIITVSYNAVQTIERTILSVLNQNYPNIEYIIIDGGSTDGTVEIIKKYAEKLSYWVSEPDKGIYDAMNKGISHATGDYVGIINSDDWYADKALKIVADASIEYPQIDIFYGDMIVFYSNDSQPIRLSDHTKLKQGMSVNHPTCFVRRTVYERKQFSLLYRMAGDYDFLLWCSVHKLQFYNVDEIISYFTPGGISSVPSIKYLDAYYIWKEHIGTCTAICCFSRDFLLKLWKYPIKKALIILLGNNRYWNLLSKMK